MCFGHMSGIIDDDTDYALQKRGRFLLKHASHITRISSQRLVDILDSVEAPHRMQYLSIDVEGAEARVLRGFPFERYQFEAVTVERPTAIVHRCLLDGGYVLVQLRWCDGFYLHNEVAAKLGVSPRGFNGTPKKFF
jgi:hypothetical protein